MEIIIVDDFSTNNIVDIIKRYKQKDKRIKFYKNDANLGVPSTRNKGIEKAIGEYVYFLDSDDFIDKDYIENFVINLI